MTINIAVKVSEGLVMAADSLSVMAGADGTDGTIHRHTEKLTEFRGLPIAMMFHGIGEIQSRTLASLVREFEFGLSENSDIVRNWTVEGISAGLYSFVRRHYDEAFKFDPSQGSGVDNRPKLGIVVGGYSHARFFPEVYLLQYPSGSWSQRFPSAEWEQAAEYIEYWGQKNPLDRILLGVAYDHLALGQRCARAAEEHRQAGTLETTPEFDLDGVRDLMRDLPPPNDSLIPDVRRYQDFLTMKHRMRGMPLQDAVEYAEYLGSVSIGYSRFSTCTPSVGGDLDVVAIQPEGLYWHRRKGFSREMASARDASARHRERLTLSRMVAQMEPTLATPTEAGERMNSAEASNRPDRSRDDEGRQA